MKKILSLLVAYFVLVGQAFAVTGVPDNLHWEAAGFGGGGTYSMIVPDHFVADKIYSIPDVNSPYVSTNNGDSWQYLSTLGAVNNGYAIAQTAAFVQSKNNANLMYAIDNATSGGIQKSTDGGQTWVKKMSVTDQPNNLKSYKHLAIDPSDDNKVYAIASGNVYRTTNGEDWSLYVSLPFDSRATAYTTSSSCSSAGYNWSSSLGKCVIHLRFIYVDDVNNDLWIGSYKDGMVRYDMDTDTQSYVDLTGTNAKYNHDFATYVDGSAVENFCVTAGWKIACTANFTDWTYTEAALSSSSQLINKFGVKRKADTTLTFVVNRRTTTVSNGEAQTALYRSTDSGATWSGVSRSQNATQNPTNAFAVGSPRIYSIVPDPFDENIWYMSSDWTMWRSDNGGGLFAEEVTNAQNTVVHDVAVSRNGTIVQVAMDTGVQMSTDGGTTWVQGTPSTAKGQGYVTFSLTDYGGHYWQVETAGTKEEWDAGNGKIFICATMYSTPTSLSNVNYVLKSVDSGTTWTRSNSGLPTVAMTGDATWGQGHCRAMGMSADETILYVGMDGQNSGAGVTGGLFKSTDLGETFTRVWPTTPNRVFNALAVDPTDSTGNTLMFGTFGTEVYGATYRLTTVTAESAELNGTGQTRTGSFNRTGQNLNPVFTSSGGEIFSPISVGSNTLSSNLGGSGTFSGSSHTYSLTFVSEPSSTTVTYDMRDYVNDTNGPGKWVVDIAYDSQGTPYAMSQKSGPNIYKSVVTSFGDGSGQYGTWRLMKNFGSSGLPDGIAIDPQNDKRIAVSVTEGSSPANRRIYITTNADKDDQSTWYDITGDFPVAGGCRALEFDYFQGTQGYLLCAANGGGLWKLNLTDSPSAKPGRTCIGGCNE